MLGLSFSKSHSEDSKGLKTKPTKTKKGSGDLAEESSEANGGPIIEFVES